MSTPTPAPPRHTRLAQALRNRDIISLGGYKVILTKDAVRLPNNDTHVMLSGHIIGTSEAIIRTVEVDRQFLLGVAK